MRDRTAALVAVGTVLMATRLGGRYNPAPNHPRTAAWYAGLSKPSFTPPGSAIGGAWAVLDGLLCLSGYRLMRARPSRERGWALGLWGANVAGLAGWPWLFFGRKKLAASLIATGGMLGTAVGAATVAARVDRLAALASTPLVGWLSFAALLNEEIWRRN